MTSKKLCGIGLLTPVNAGVCECAVRIERRSFNGMVEDVQGAEVLSRVFNGNLLFEA